MCWPCSKTCGNSIAKAEEREERDGRKGRLTDAMIDKLQNYYGIAIRSNLVILLL